MSAFTTLPCHPPLLEPPITKKKGTPLCPTPPRPAPQQRGALNKAQLDELTKAEQIARAAQKTAYAAALLLRDILAAFVTLLLTDIAAARKKAADALQSTSGKESATVSEATAQKSLLIAMQEVQAAARQKYARTDPPKLQDYFVGSRLDESRALLEEYSAAVIEKLGTDTLPGITPAKVTALGTLRTAYVNADDTQGGAQSDATTERGDLVPMLKSITDRRMTIQFAADAEWPYTEDANHDVRKEFKLPNNQPFGG